MGDGPGSIEPEGLFEGLSGRAIAYGVVLDIVLTILLSIPLVILFGGPEMFSEDADIARAAEARAYASDLFNLASLLLGVACTIVGAFVGARRAGRSFVRHGGWIGVGSLVLGVLMLALLPEGPGQPLWIEVLGLVLVVPAGALGGQLAAALARSGT